MKDQNVTKDENFGRLNINIVARTWLQFNLETAAVILQL